MPSRSARCWWGRSLTTAPSETGSRFRFASRKPWQYRPTAVVVLQQTQPAGRYNIYADARYAFYARRGLAFTRITDFGVPA